MLKTVSFATREPEAEGLKASVTVQLVYAAIMLPQPLVWEKSPALVPERLIELRVTLPGPSLLKETNRVAEEPTVAGEKVTEGTVTVNDAVPDVALPARGTA